MWICKACGNINTVIPKGVKAFEIDEDYNIVSYDYDYVECCECHKRKEDIAFLADWVEEIFYEK